MMKCKLFMLILLSLTVSEKYVWAQQGILTASIPQKVTNGFEFTEGPYWHPDGYLLFSDIPDNTIYRWKPGSMEADIFIKPSGHSNGITTDNKGRLVLAQHDGMISIIGEEQRMEILADEFEGKRLNSPNDLAISSRGIIYFTDPPFGVNAEERKLSFSGVYMLKKGERPQLMVDEFDLPNGIVLNEDESQIYVNNTATGQIMCFEIAEDGSLQNPTAFANVGAADESGGADGMAMDQEGRLYSTGPGGIYIFSPEGNQIEKIGMPTRTTNLTWGGPENKTLYITTPSAIYQLKMKVEGVSK
ncbi:SMP-30/gluconolactonase/LRE family protein [Fodinibius salsisoli]|uniref:SMP-30/gluconolactonase/LRE family protein n=1 Tax=Fodinibius salsisoli TaxID=2820877 RepID=A0ABT3PQQ7_9BACT|nr:SMP-30/gluconolactonase/LRE family protein [Fodinibius salsisoli]MCW9708190.1 SMP-30/gluconolactonase/LRE family protein [Fodinibius salsisoli]